MSSQPGQDKNYVDALRRAMQLPVSQIAGGQNTVGATFTVSLNPPTIQAPGGVANSYQSTVDVASVNAFTGIVTLTEADTLPTGSVGFGISGATLQVAPNADGLTELNVNITVSTPSGTYSVTVTGTTTVNGVTITASGVASVIVGAGAGKCVNANDCGTGLQCVGGQCYSCPINSSQHSGPCVSRDTSICKGETGGSATSACGGCYCTECNGTQDCVNKYGSNYCQTKMGACSALACIKGECVCTKCNNTANPITVTCPSNVTACLDATTPKAQTAVSQFTVTNTDSLSAYNVNMTMTPVGQKCSCCGLGPSLSTGGGYSIGPAGAVTTTITVPLTCTSTQCYSWNLKVTVALAISNQVIQTFTCPFQICTTTQPCFVIEANCNTPGAPRICSPTNIWSQLVTETMPGTCASGNCWGGGSNSYLGNVVTSSIRIRSVNNFAGTVNLVASPCPSTCGPNCNMPASSTLSAGGTNNLGTFSECIASPKCCSGIGAHPTLTATQIFVAVGTSGSLTQTASINSTICWCSL